MALPPVSDAAPDAALVAQAQAGDREAFAVLYTRWHPRILRSLRQKMTGYTHDAEDLAADVFCQILAHLDTYRASGVPFGAWVLRIRRNRLIDYYHATLVPGTAERREYTFGTGAAFAPATSAGAIDESSWEQRVARWVGDRVTTDGGLAGQEVRALLADALATLTPDQRRTVGYRWVADYSVEKTARRMGKHPDAIKQLQVRAFATLRRVLAPAIQEPGA